MGKLAILILFFSFFSFQALTAQKNNVFYAEFLGAGLMLSLNYDTRLSKQTDGLGMRIGLGVYELPYTGDTGLNIPFQINYLLGKGNHKIEVGFGVTYSKHLIAPSSAIMYRYQWKGRPAFFRFGLSPLYIAKPKNVRYFIPEYLLPGVSFGFRF